MKHHMQGGSGYTGMFPEGCLLCAAVVIETPNLRMNQEG